MTIKLLNQDRASCFKAAAVLLAAYEESQMKRRHQDGLHCADNNDMINPDLISDDLIQ